MELIKYITANPVKKYMTSEEITMMFTSKKNYREDEMIDIKEENIFSTNKNNHNKTKKIDLCKQ